MSDYAPPPPKKKRKTKKSKVDKGIQYASVEGLEDEEVKCQLERRRQGFTSNITVARDS